MTKFKRIMAKKFERVLPYSTIEELWHTYDDFEDFACAIEQAVLAKLAEQQEPVFYSYAGGVYAADSMDMCDYTREYGTPLYAYPMPSSQVNLDSSNHIPHGRSIEDLADDLYTKGYKEGGVKDWDPRGCREWQDVVDAYNSKSPDGWQLVPKEPTEEMHLAAQEWSVRKYGKAIGFEASLGCYKAMVTAAPEYKEGDK